MVNQTQPAFINVIFHSVAEKYFKCGLICSMMVYFWKNFLSFHVLYCIPYENNLSFRKVGTFPQRN